MSLSRVQYTGDGATTLRVIPFPYLSEAYIEVSVGGVVLAPADYTFPSASTLDITAAPASGAAILIKRVTPSETRLVDFQDGAILTEQSLDLSADQTFHLVQETIDYAEEAGADAMATSVAAAATSAGAAATSAAAAVVSKNAAAASAAEAALYDPTLKQDKDATLTALAGLNSDVGLVEQTGPDSFAKVGKETIGAGKQTVWIPAGAMVPNTTSGAASGTAETPTNKVMLKTLDFDAAALEKAQFSIRMPKSWNEGTLSAYFVWRHPATTTNFAVVWALRAVAISDDDALDAAFGTAVSVTDTGGTTDDLYQSAETAVMTVAGTPAAGDVVVFEAYRDAANGSDTLAVDARLHGVVLIYTTDVNSDA